jgi:hypothetical protein
MIIWGERTLSVVRDVDADIDPHTANTLNGGHPRLFSSARLAANKAKVPSLIKTASSAYGGCKSHTARLRARALHEKRIKNHHACPEAEHCMRRL